MNDKFKKTLESIGLLKTLRKSGALNPLIGRLLLQVHHSANPEKEIEVLQNMILVSSMNKSPFDMPGSSAKGLIKLAQAENKSFIGINPEECHVLLAGQTGAGKSSLLQLAFSQALDLGINIWMFARDPHMRGLLSIDSNILVVNFDSIVRINPLYPCGISETVHSNQFADIFIQANTLYDGTKNYIIEHLNAIYKKHNEYNTYPTMHDLYYYIKALKHMQGSRESYFRESILNRLVGMLSGPLGDVFDCSKGHDEYILSSNCIFEIESLTREQQIFFINLMLTKLFYYRLKA